MTATSPSVVVILPSIVSPKLEKAIKSIEKQDYPNLEVLVVIDGLGYVDEWIDFDKKHSNPWFTKNVHACIIPWNVGGNGFYGHRVYAAFPHLVNHDYIAFLDEDNWYLPRHIHTLSETLTKFPNAMFAHSLREIYDEKGEFVTKDNCESLGEWQAWTTPAFATKDQEVRLVDTSSFMFKRQFLTQVSQLWHWGWGGDRRFFNLMRNQVKCQWACTGQYTLAYGLDGNPNSVTKEFFIEGNKRMRDKWKDAFPWAKEEIYP